MKWQVEGEAAAQARAAFHLDVAAVETGDGVGDGESHAFAGTHRPGGEEGIEDAFQMLRRDAAAVVLHRQADLAAVGAAAVQAHHAFGRDGQQGIVDEVFQGLLQPFRQAVQRRQGVVALFQAEVVALLAGPFRRRAADGFQVGLAPFAAGAGAGELQEMAYHRAHPGNALTGFGQHLGGVLAQEVQVDALPAGRLLAGGGALVGVHQGQQVLQVPGHGAQVALDVAEGSVDLVGHAGGQLADGGQLFGMEELVVGLGQAAIGLFQGGQGVLQGPFGPFPLADVVEHEDGADRLVLLQDQGLVALDDDGGTVPLQEHLAAVLELRLPRQGIGLVAIEHGGHRLGQHVLHRPAQQARGSRVGEGDAAVGIQAEDAFTGRVQDQFVGAAPAGEGGQHLLLLRIPGGVVVRFHGVPPCSGRGAFAVLDQRVKIVLGQHVVEIQDQDETLVHLGHAPDEIGAQVGAEGRWRFDLGVRDVQDLVHRIHHDAHHLGFLGGGGLDDDDAGAPSDHGRCVAEAAAQIDHRDHGAAEVDHAADRVGHHWHHRQVAVLDDFPDVEDAHGEQFIAQLEGEALGTGLRLPLGSGGDWCVHGHSP